MKKIPTLFVRDEDTNRRYVKNEVTPGCEWVLAGEGVATRKYDGTCCMIRDKQLFKRHEVKPGKTAPVNFEQIDHDDVTGKTVGWVPVGSGNEDRWHREAFNALPADQAVDGTYELVGPKIQGNPEGYVEHRLISHANADRYHSADDELTFDGLRGLFTGPDFAFEGIVWHHPDGRMAKLKKKDFPR